MNDNYKRGKVWGKMIADLAAVTNKETRDDKQYKTPDLFIRSFCGWQLLGCVL